MLANMQSRYLVLEKRGQVAKSSMMTCAEQQRMLANSQNIWFGKKRAGSQVIYDDMCSTAQNACKHNQYIWFGKKRAGSQLIYDDMCLPVLLVIYFMEAYLECTMIV
jgi:hypothetical protein